MTLAIKNLSFSLLFMRKWNSRNWVALCKRLGICISLAMMANTAVEAQGVNFGRSKECTILYFDALSDRDLSVVKMYSHAMIAAGYRVTIENYYDEGIEARARPMPGRLRNKPKFWVGQSFESDRFGSDEQKWYEEKPVNVTAVTEEDGIAKLEGDVFWLTEAYSRDWGSGRRNRTYQLELRGKNFIRYKRGEDGPDPASDRVFLIYPNDKVSHQYSCDRYDNARNRSDLVVDIPKDQLLRPEAGGIYKVPFDSVGYFATYHVSLRGYSGFVGSGAALIDEEVKWGRQGKADIYLEPGNSRSRCYLVIHETFLSNRCLRVRNQYNSDVEEGDDGQCGCGAECLYKSVFALSMQGLPMGDCKGSWSPEATVRFQCTK